MMKISKDTKAMAITALASAAALFTVVSTNLDAGQQPLAGNGYHDNGYYGNGHYGYRGGHQRAAPPGYLYYAPGSQSRMQQVIQQPANRGTPDPSTDGGEPASGATNVSIARMQFVPATISVKTGEQVTWINNEPMPHTVTSQNNGLLASDRLGRGSTFTHTFKQPGIYTYYCALHPSMTGKVIVE
ncbi:MAG: cupredoxin family copper-binding protein [Gammaproteobacteria bacterium]|jgi:plastocyanin